MRSLVCVACVVFLGATSLASLQANAQQANSLAGFSSEEDSVPGAVPLPECARTWLARDARVSRQLDRLHLSLAQLPDRWFAAGAVNFGKPDEKLLVVMGNSRELTGANTAPFWILLWTGQSCDLLLTTAAHHLELLDTKTHGLPDVQIGFASTGNTSDHQYKFSGRAYREADDACRPEQAEHFNAIEGKNLRMYLFQRPGQSTENLLCEARAWAWQNWEQKKSFDLNIRLFSKEGEQTSLSYSDIVTDGRWQIDILVHKEVVDESAPAGASHRVVKDELISAITIQRRFARNSNPDRTGVVPESESVPPDKYELHFLDQASKDVATL
jgi:hypothetical protein